MDFNTETTDSLPQWLSFVSDLTPSFTPSFTPRTYLEKRSLESYGPQSISRIFFTELHYHRDDQISGSNWTLEMLSRYMNIEEHIGQLLIDTDRVDDQSGKMNKIVQETMDMFDASNTNPELENVLATEADVRIHLSAILRKMCPELGLTLRTESQIELGYLPTCKFDFLFLTRGGKPVGCMEAKTPSTMNSRAFAQAVVELLVLQQLAYQHDVNISTVPLFNVLSDGQRFVLMQVKGEKLCLEYASKTGKECTESPYH
ncbi:uncharacterized protein LOC121380168 [Gigantopelta aegis]|uniref:uncharacterized protein LOC121380168 n=1 Tax=Gigantopelta aegis TaxID=1735272 RepID=UPI001B88D322|nr:uncharacterized protein LOC121380168 [Gigantopelta aegis]